MENMVKIRWSSVRKDTSDPRVYRHFSAAEVNGLWRWNNPTRKPTHYFLTHSLNCMNLSNEVFRFSRTKKNALPTTGMARKEWTRWAEATGDTTRSPRSSVTFSAVDMEIGTKKLLEWVFFSKILNFPISFSNFKKKPSILTLFEKKNHREKYKDENINAPKSMSMFQVSSIKDVSCKCASKHEFRICREPTWW